MTRLIKNPQMELGEVDISKIVIPTNSRDDIPKILKGLQYIYITPSVREKVFNILEQKISPEINKQTGRPGMPLWKIFVMGVIRLDLNCDYDRLQSFVNYHTLIRQMLGHADRFDEYSYNLQTIKDNVKLLTPELLNEVNLAIVECGHALLKKKETEVLRGRCDSFVFETNVHYPTDINLLFDAVRKAIQLTAKLCHKFNISSWRQYAYNVKDVKGKMRAAQKRIRSEANTPKNKAKREILIIEAIGEYVDTSQKYLNKAQITLNEIANTQHLNVIDLIQMDDINYFTSHGIRQIDHVKRRFFENESIPHEEKIFSLFQPHTELIKKGKAGVPQEFGVRVCIMEDHNRFILHHMVMEKQRDQDVAVSMASETKERFPKLNSVSYDKGFHSPENQKDLKNILEVTALKMPGKLTDADRIYQSSSEYRKASHKHSAVESAINALEVHGLDVCPDDGIDGFKRYVALAIVTRNIHRIGDILINIEKKKELRRNRNCCQSDELKLAA